MGQPAAVILAASRRRVAGYGDDGLLCLVEFGGRTVLEWWLDYLGAWGITDPLIVAAQADRRRYGDGPHVGIAELAQCLFVGPGAAGDPLDQLIGAIADIDHDLLLIIDADTLPPPVNPYDLLPTVVDAACLALGPVSPGWQHGYSIGWLPGTGQVPVTRVINDPASAPRTALFTESLGITATRRLSLLAATTGPNPARSWTELHTRWATSGALAGRFYPTPPPRFGTPVELAIARSDFDTWRALDLAVSSAAMSTDSDEPDTEGPS